MGKRIETTVGQRVFRTKGLAKEHYKKLLNKYRVGQKVMEFTELYDLLKKHHEFRQKEGVGVGCFTVERDLIHGTNHFMIHRIDGTNTDFSYDHCLNAKPNKTAGIMDALRYEVRDQTIQFKKEQLDQSKGPIRCPFTKEELSWDHCHVDHVTPKTFKFLVEEWSPSEGITDLVAQVAITASKDNQTITSMTNRSQKESWANFHAANADLRLLSPRGNLSEARKL